MLCSRLISSLASIVLFFAPVVSALDETEEAIRASVNDHLPSHLDLLERVVNINSGTMNVSGVTRVGREFAAAFDDLGFCGNDKRIPGQASHRLPHNALGAIGFGSIKEVDAHIESHVHLFVCFSF